MNQCSSEGSQYGLIWSCIASTSQKNACQKTDTGEQRPDPHGKASQSAGSRESSGRTNRTPGWVIACAMSSSFPVVDQ